MRRVIYRPRATFDLKSIAIYLGEVCKNPQASRQTYTGIKGAIKELAEMPTLGRPFEGERLQGKGYRIWLVGNYRVFYTYNDERLEVWRVVHARRDIDDYDIIGWDE